MNIERCCQVCKGSPPYAICRDKHKCLCHLEQDLLAQKYRAGSHRDPTYFTALRNINNEQSGKK